MDSHPTAMQLEEIVLSAQSGQCTRTAWYLPGGEKPRRIGVFLDGEYYIERMQAPALITRLQEQHDIEPMACLFISQKNAAARHHDYTCSESYLRFITDDVLPWITTRSSVETNNGHFIAGTSLSGLQAAFTAMKRPDIFSNVLSHSGSFWWNKEWLTAHLSERPSDDTRYWLSAGTKEQGAGMIHPPTNLRQEVNQIDAVERLVTRLKQRGNDVHYHLYEGGHDLESWKAELPDALRWLLGKKTA